MNARLWPVFALILLAPAPAGFGADPDNFGDPLPEGAKARVGTARLFRPGGNEDWAGAVLTPDGRFLLAPAPGGAIERLDLSGRVVGTIGEKLAARTARERLYLSADGTRGASASGDTVTAWDTKTGRVLTRIERTLPTGGAAVALSADGSALAVGDTTKRTERRPLTVIVWDVGAPKRRLDVEVTHDFTACAALAPDGKVLATWGLSYPEKAEDPFAPDSAVQFWDAVNGKALGSITVKGVTLPDVTFTPDGRSAALTAAGGKVLFIDPKTGRETGRLSTRAEPGGRLHFAPDGKALAACKYDGTVCIWDVPADKEISVTKCPVRLHSAVGARFVGGNRAVAWAVRDTKAVVWEVPSGKVLSPTGGPPGEVRAVAFSPDGKEVLTDEPDWAFARWDAANGKPLGTRKLEVPAGANLPEYRNARVFPGGTIVEAWGAEQHYVHDARTGKRLRDIGPRGSGTPYHICADGELILTQLGEPAVEAPRQIRPQKFAVKNMATGKTLTEIETVAPGVAGVARTPDGKRLVTSVYAITPGTVEEHTYFTLWDLATGKKLGEVKEKGASVSFTPAPGNTSILTTGPGIAFRELDLTTGKVTRTIDTGGFLLTGILPVFSPDGKVFAVPLIDRTNPGREDYPVLVYDTATGKVLKALRGHKGSVLTLGFAPDGATLATGSADTTVLLWDVPKPK